MHIIVWYFNMAYENPYHAYVTEIFWFRCVVVVEKIRRFASHYFWLFHNWPSLFGWSPSPSLGLQRGNSTLLGPQSRLGDKVLIIWVVCPHNGSAVLTGLTVAKVTTMATATARLGGVIQSLVSESQWLKQGVVRYGRNMTLPPTRTYCRGLTLLLDGW